MTSREMRALETMEQIVAFLRVRAADRDAAIERLLDSIEADRRRLLEWMLLHDRGEPPHPPTAAS